MSDCTEECAAVLRDIYAYLDGEMQALDCAKIQQHLADCGSCAREHEVDCVIKAVVKRSCTGEAAPEDLRQRVVAGLAGLRLNQPPQGEISS